MVRPPMEMSQTYSNATARVKAGQARKMTEHGTFQIKAMFFQVAKHFFNPHSASVIAQGHLRSGRLVARHQGSFSPFPNEARVDRVDFVFCQADVCQPHSFDQPFGQNCPIFANHLCFIPDTRTGFLTQNIKPTPLIQLSQNLYRSKFAVSNQKNHSSLGSKPLTYANKASCFHQYYAHERV